MKFVVFGAHQAVNSQAMIEHWVLENGLFGNEKNMIETLTSNVQQLIQDAIDPDRLCNMFPGWAGWL
ncbi:hypothetical protein CTI12_AA217690 [Artemisia annua]|uniref:FATC domain-containing protein n=1 Tax=Artemisia annua TaxID=35608 RepID=A0A2U1NQG9_ARTAN|nr:hypothetical protein CTI12_AA217690 [Artemisia annua]